MPEVIASVFFIMGAAFLLLAGAALIRMPDIYTRISAASKAVTAGAGACFIAGAVFFLDYSIAMRAVAGLAFFLLTSPVAAHVVARAAVYVGIPFARGTNVEGGEEGREALRDSR